MTDIMTPDPRTIRLSRRIESFYEMACSAARLSCCKRAQIGCLVTDTRFAKVHAFGYNGPCAGLPNDSCTAETPCTQCGSGRCGCVHAEANSIAKLSPRDVYAEEGIMFVTAVPCRKCAELIVNCYCIAAVVCGNQYRNDKGSDLLNECGIKVIQGRSWIEAAHQLVNAGLG